MATTDGRDPQTSRIPVHLQSFLTREDVVRSRRETDGIVDKARSSVGDLQTVTADLLRLIEEFKSD